MFESKYSSFLTALLVIIIVGIIGLLGYLGYTFFQKSVIDKESGDFVDTFLEETSDDRTGDGDVGNLDVDETPVSSTGTRKYKGYDVVGTIEIPATNVKYPILDSVTKGSIEAAVAVMWPANPTLNKPGNVVIAGHNYRNGLFFSNNKRLNSGDKIYITDLEGTRLSYTIYDKFETTSEDTRYIYRNTNGAREISLSTCTDASDNQRIIILAKADGDS